jgi:glycosyltransferase involved in cell wall biosynthesis
MFDRLAGKYSQVSFVGPQNPAGVRRYLAGARMLLSASRWEGSPVVGNEALAMGASVVGTPIPAFIDICRRGNFGTFASRHSAQALADALAHEWNQWETGKRNPVAIAQYWRPQLSSEVVVSTLMRLLQGNRAKARAEKRVVQTV